MNQEQDMTSPVRVEAFARAFDDLCALEKKNGTFDDPFHARRRHFASADIRDARIRDVSEMYVATRSDILRRAIDQKVFAEAGRVALGTKNQA